MRGFLEEFFDDVLHRAFGTPRGVLGKLGGALMSRGNAPTEEHIVRVAAPGGTETVLVLGPGPGVGLAAAAERAGRVIGVEPSAEMRAAAGRRCAPWVTAGQVELRAGTASCTGLADDAVDVAVSVNNVQLWDDLAAGFAELARVLRPGGRLVLSVHERWAPAGLPAAVRAAGFTDVQTWRWEPDGPMATTALHTTALQLRAVLPVG